MPSAFRLPPSAFRHPPSRRRGVTMVESMFVLSVLLLILLAILDLGLAVLSYNSLSSAARRTAREAIVRGQHSPPERRAWGPTAYQDTADDEAEPAATVRSSLATLPPKDVHVKIEWLDGGNRVDHRVRVTLRYRYVPIVPFPFREFYDLTAVSTMKIAH